MCIAHRVVISAHLLPTRKCGHKRAKHAPYRTLPTRNMPTHIKNRAQEPFFKEKTDKC